MSQRDVWQLNGSADVFRLGFHATEGSSDEDGNSRCLPGERVYRSTFDSAAPIVAVSRRLILHGGTHKTGSTTLQHCLFENRGTLAEHGIRYVAGELKGEKTFRSHNWIAQAFTGQYDYTPDDVSAAIAETLDGARPADACIISSEDLSVCCSGHKLWGALGSPDFRPLQQEYLSTVAAFLGKFDIEPVLVFRHVDEYAQSLYQTLIGSGRIRCGFEEFLSIAEPLLDYDNQISAFERAFGKPKLLSFRALSGDDLANRFLDAMGVSCRVPVATQHRNRSTDARITYWQANREVDGDAMAKRRFGQSELARSLFPDFGSATFWGQDLDPIEFHKRYAQGFRVGFFPPVQRPASNVNARIADHELDRISEAYHQWLGSAKRRKMLEKTRPLSFLRRLRHSLFGKRQRAQPKQSMPDIVGGETHYLLRSPDALKHVMAVRKSAALAGLRRDLTDRFSGRRCIVIGSAPNAGIVNPSPEDRVICVNASGWLAKQAGVRTPDLTVLVGRSLDGGKPVRVASVDALHDLRTDWLLFVEIAVSEGDAKAILDGVGMTFDRLSNINSLERAAILGEAWGEEIALGPGTYTGDRPSTGVFAASIALWAGASEVVLCGFSLAGGHAYIEGDTPRNHVKGDRQFFSLARKLSCRIGTTSPALSEEFGLPLHKGVLTVN